MGIVALKCPSCGADVSIDSKSDFGICEFCGTKVMQEKIIVEHRVNETDKYNNCVELANRAYQGRNYEEAYSYYKKALEIKQDDYMLFFRKSICAGNLSEKNERTNEVISGIESAYSLGGEEHQKEMAADIAAFITDRDLGKPVEFNSAKECEKYIQRAYGHIELADNLFRYVDDENPDVVENYCQKIVDICKEIKPTIVYRKINPTVKQNRNIDLSLSGLSISNKTDVDDKGSYTTPKEILGNAKQLKEKYAKIKTEKLKQNISVLRTEAKSLPVPLRILHGISDLPMIIVALLLCS